MQSCRRSRENSQNQYFSATIRRYGALYRNREFAARHPLYSQSVKRIPFEFTIKLPMPLRTGVDYGFLPGKNISKKARSVD